MNRSFNNKPSDDDASEVWCDGDSAISGIRVRSGSRSGLALVMGGTLRIGLLFQFRNCFREMAVDPIDVMRGQDRSCALRRS